MNRRWNCTVLFFFCLSALFAQEGPRISVSGIIRDAVSGEHLAGATVWVPALRKGTSANAYGYYALTLPPGQQELEISFVGYRKLTLSLIIYSDTVINWELASGLEVGEVSITGHLKDNTIIRSAIPGVYYLSSNRAELSPSLLGESDALKTIQLLPGVKSGNEGTSGINVRGGSHDQNLILLDGVPVYNTNHLFGYLSTFNTDAVRDMRFFKGGIPARYGGRLSSVLDLSMKEGNLKEAGGHFSVSPVSGRLMLEGPLKKDMASYMISGRRSWIDLPLRLEQLISGDLETLGYTFYDLNAKINWIISPGNRIYLSHYQGRDQYFVNSKDSLTTDRYSFKWGNVTSVLRWNLVLAPAWFMNTSAYHSLYRFNEQFENSRDKEKSGQYTKSGLEEFSLKGDLDFSTEGHAVKFGYQFSWQTFTPELTSYSGYSTGYSPPSAPAAKSLSVSVYAEDETTLSQRFTLIAGVRLLTFISGNKTRYYTEPRVSTRYALSEHTDLKISWQRMVQTMHLLTNNALNMPTDLWVPATETTFPAEAWLADLGVMTTPFSGWTFEADAYYKPMNHLLEYRPGVILTAGSGKTWEELTISGKGLNYGAEFMAEKTTGRLTGWAGYSLSWSERKFPDINRGRFFPFKYDRRHDFTLLANYRLKDNHIKKNTVTVAFVFASGNAITIPDEHIKGMLLPGLDKDFPYLEHFSWFESFPHPNNYRMPPFHHLDAAYAASKKLNKSRERTWKISVYNIYNRLNPYFYYKDGDSFMQISMLPVVPSVSWSLKF